VTVSAVADSEDSRLRWSYLSTISTAAMQLIASATITRFLRPSDYGLAAMAMFCSSMTGYFTQLGMGRAVIQKPSLTNGNIRAAFSLSMLTGIGGFGVLFALSPLLARYFREAQLTPIIAAFGLNLIFQAAGTVANSLLRREFRIRDLAICDFLGYLFSTFGIGLPMAIAGYGVWALVGSNVSQPLISTVLYFVARPHSVMPSVRRDDYRHIAGFGGKAGLTTSVEAFGGSLDMIILGRLVSPSALGLYNRSLTLSTMPGYNISQGLTRVFHPSIARAAEESLARCVTMLVESERQLMSFILPFCAGAAVAAPTIIPVIFGRQWTPAIPVFRALCLVAALDASFHLPAIQLEVLSLFRHKLILQVMFALCFGAGILLTAPRGGVLAVAFFYAFLQAIRTVGLHTLSARSLDTSIFLLLRSWTPGLLCAAAISAALLLAQDRIPGFSLLNGALRLSILMLLAAGLMVLIYRIFWRDSVYRSWRSLLRRRAQP
jgi:O-antigen/teichoic acid export membrane protein